MARYNAKFTEELAAKFCEAISKGHSIEGACGIVDITYQTYRNWYKRGEKAKSGKYKQFVCDVDAAHAKATSLAETPIIDAIPKDVKTAQWWLSKRRQEYADRTYNETKLDAEVKSDLLVKLERPLPELKDD